MLALSRNYSLKLHLTANADSFTSLLIKARFICTVKRPPVKRFLTYKGAPFGVEFSGHADTGAQVEHDEHCGDHDDTLQQQQRLKVAAKSVEERQKNVWLFFETRTGHEMSQSFGTKNASHASIYCSGAGLMTASGEVDVMYWRCACPSSYQS